MEGVQLTTPWLRTQCLSNYAIYCKNAWAWKEPQVFLMGEMNYFSSHISQLSTLT